MKEYRLEGGGVCGFSYRFVVDCEMPSEKEHQDQKSQKT